MTVGAGPDPAKVQMGVYRHYKGPLYLVLGLAHDANELVAGSREHDWTGPGPIGDRTCKHCGQDPRTWSGEWCESVPRTVVVYVGLQLDAAHLGPRLAVRTLDDFQAWICANEKCPRYERVVDHERTDDPPGTPNSCYVAFHGHQRRFQYLGPELTAAMLP